jgi:3-isopropylmalate/(R)-2-methylmalate dehydratase small subunit
MEKFTVHTGLVVPLDRANVDTDAIIPKQFLKSIKRTGFGENLFDAWRFLDTGEPGWIRARAVPIPTSSSTTRSTRARRSCSRARTSAAARRASTPVGAAAVRLQGVIAPSFADIFFTNSFKNGFLPIVLTELEVDHLFNEAAAHPGYKLTIDLAAKTVSTPSGKTMGFDIDATRRENLLNGLDEIGLTLKHSGDIRAYEEKRKRSEPWIFS